MKHFFHALFFFFIQSDLWAQASLCLMWCKLHPWIGMYRASEMLRIKWSDLFTFPCEKPAWGYLIPDVSLKKKKKKGVPRTSPWGNLILNLKSKVVIIITSFETSMEKYMPNTLIHLGKKSMLLPKYDYLFHMFHLLVKQSLLEEFHRTHSNEFFKF